MIWQEACEHKSLQNLPFKVELNESGQIIMTPVKVYHSAFQGRIAFLLYSSIGHGEVLTECAISTEKGTKVADVAWASHERFKHIQDEIECSIAPEICVEILFDSNTEDEINTKKKLYFQSGAKEVWTCSKNGNITFYDHHQQLEKSRLAPAFKKKI